MTPAQLQRLQTLPSPSAALQAYTAALALFIIADAPGYHPSPEAWGKANDDKEEAWDKLCPSERELVRAIAGGEGR